MSWGPRAGLGWGAASSPHAHLLRDGTNRSPGKPLSSRICLSSQEPHSQAPTGSPRGPGQCLWGLGGEGVRGGANWTKITGRVHIPDSRQCPIRWVTTVRHGVYGPGALLRPQLLPAHFHVGYVSTGENRKKITDSRLTCLRGSFHFGRLSSSLAFLYLHRRDEGDTNHAFWLLCLCRHVSLPRSNGLSLRCLSP